MPVANSPALTPQKLAANRANVQQSHGRVTAEGFIRVRDSHIRQGRYVQENETLRVPDEHVSYEDAKEFQRRFRSVRANWKRAGELEGRPIEGLTLRMNIRSKPKKERLRALASKIKTCKMKETPTMLLIIKDRIFYPTIL
jgi:hypothetical protein